MNYRNNTQRKNSLHSLLSGLYKKIAHPYSKKVKALAPAFAATDLDATSPYPVYTQRKRERKRRFASAMGIVNAMLRLAVCAVSGFVFALGRVGQSVYPFGTALLISGISFVKKDRNYPEETEPGEYKNTLAIFVGVSLACLLYDSFALPYIGLNLAVLIVRMGFLSSGTYESLKIKMATATVACAFMAVPRLVFSPSAFSVLETVIHFVLTACGVYVLSKIRDDDGVSQGCMSAYAVCAMLVFCLREVTYFGSQIGFVCASLATMCFSAVHGSVHGCAAGALLGAVCFKDACLSTVLAACGLADGIRHGHIGRHKLWQYRIFVPTLHFVGSLVFPMLLCADLATRGRIVIDSIISVFVYMSFMHRLEIPQNKSILGVDTNDVPNDFDGLSDAFSSLSDVFYKMSDKLRTPPPYEIRLTVERACREYCTKCPHTAGCKAASVIAGSDYIIGTLAKTPSRSGKLRVSDIPHSISGECRDISGLVSHINTSYKTMFSDYFKNNKTELLAAQYSSVARLIRYTSKSSAERNTPCIAVAAAALDALDNMGIRPERVSATSGRGTVIDAHGVRIETVSQSPAYLAAKLSEATGILLSTPEFLMEPGDGAGIYPRTRMRFKAKRRICVEYAKACHAKNAEAVSGDSVSFFESDKDYFYALISDGMGSGREAALTSRLTSVFIEKLLSTGAHKGATLELLNNLLLAKNNECFATVDLLEIDLLEAKASFIKAGAAPAFVVRSAKLYKISSETPPAGIINAFTAENTSFSLRPGDVILLLSDGIIEGFDDTPWLSQILGFHSTGDISLLASKILAKAKELCTHDDDMSVVAVRVR